MNLMLLPLLFLSSLIITHLLVPLVSTYMLKAGIVGFDVHKPGRPPIPEMGGLAIVASLIISSGILLILNPDYWVTTTSFMLTIIIACIIGVTDDLKPLNPKLKPVLTALAGLPIIVLGAYSPFPNLPFIGYTRLTIVYPILIPIAVAVTSNSVNMMDVFNGVMPGTCSVVAFTAFSALLLLNRFDEAALPIMLFGGLLAYYRFNRYPAKVFSGDSGSLAVGAALGSIAIIGRIEVLMLVALMPHIMNAFYGLSSIGRIYERREVKHRPTVVLEDGMLDASHQVGTPITLARLILSHGPLNEKGVTDMMIWLTIISSILAFITMTLIIG